MPQPQTVEAIYEDGVLRPIKALSGLPEYSRVKITIEYDQTPPHPLLQFAGILSDDEAATLQRALRDECQQPDSDR